MVVAPVIFGASTVQLAPGRSSVPPTAGTTAGHTVKEHLLVTVIGVALAPAANAATRRRSRTGEALVAPAGDAIMWKLWVGVGSETLGVETGAEAMHAYLSC